ncbi:hypothetical protein Tco_0915250, partial [Tanacetum coccineum]
MPDRPIVRMGHIKPKQTTQAQSNHSRPSKLFKSERATRFQTGMRRQPSKQQSADFISEIYMTTSSKRQISDERRLHEPDGIFKALKMVCDNHNLPLAQTWALSEYGSFGAKSGHLEQTCSSFNKSCIGR